MLKLVGSLLICLAVSSIGFIYCEGLKQRVRYLEAIKRFIVNCNDKMRFGGSNIFTIFDDCEDKELLFFKKINRENIMDKNFLERLFKNLPLDEGDIKALIGFIEKLGSSDIEGQKTHCDYFFDVFSNLYDDAKLKLSDNGKLFRTLFIFGGLALFILII